MEFKKLLNKVHDKVSHNSTPIPPATSAPIRRQSFKDKKQATISRWRDKWGDVSRPRFFNNNNANSNRNSTIKNHRNDVFCPPLPTSVAALASPPPPNFQVPTITVSSPTLLKRSQSTIDHRPTSKSNYFVHKKQRPTSYTPAPPPLKHQRLSVPHVVGHLRSLPSTATCDYASSLDNSDDDDAGSFYNHPILGAPPRQVTWHVPQSAKMINRQPFDDFHESILSMSSTTTSSSSSISSVIATAPTMDRHAAPHFRGHDSAFLGHETLKQHNEESTSESENNDDDTDSFIIAPARSQEPPPHYQLAMLNVTNTMMVMREHQLELRMTKTRIENQRLQQQMEDMISGTWTSTTHLLAENDRLEIQIQQLQQQQRLVRSSISNGRSELYWREEHDGLRQQGLLKYLEGEPDLMAALDRFKKLLTSC